MSMWTYRSMSVWNWVSHLSILVTHSIRTSTDKNWNTWLALEVACWHRLQILQKTDGAVYHTSRVHFKILIGLSMCHWFIHQWCERKRRLLMGYVCSSGNRSVCRVETGWNRCVRRNRTAPARLSPYAPKTVSPSIFESWIDSFGPPCCLCV